MSERVVIKQQWCSDNWRLLVFLCETAPDKYRGVQEAYDWSDIDAHEHLPVDVLQAEVAVLHLTVSHIIVEDQLHLQKACKIQLHHAVCCLSVCV